MKLTITGTHLIGFLIVIMPQYPKLWHEARERMSEHVQHATALRVPVTQNQLT
jgi:hypothetical protein